MMKKIFYGLAILMLVFVPTTYASVAPIECSIDLSTCPWSSDESSTWETGAYTLDIICTQGGAPVENYVAEFDIILQKGDPEDYQPIAVLKTFSTITDSNGKAKIKAPLLHIPIEIEWGWGYIHICPFDDIIYVGGSFEELPVYSMQSIGLPKGNFTYDPKCFPWLKKGCCETTITVKCCTPWRVIKYCTIVTQLQCYIGNYDPDPCTSISTVWSPNGYCNYCSGVCEEETVIELVSFKALKSKGKVQILWETASETNNYGFNIYRAENKNGEYVKINSEIIPANGSPTQGASYEYVDTSIKSMKAYYYKLEDVDRDGTTTFHEPVKAVPKVLYDIFN
ncbi:MAG: hypothetical protein N3B18_10760 [Desulfobacterota bacterium]|nr:hypothetical protein [Thermodesulfobacteriota bacterium]